MNSAPRMSQAEWHQYHRLLRTHPEQYLRIAEDAIRRYPDDPEGYEDCVYYWIRFKQYDYALSDMTTVVALEDSCLNRSLRATVLRLLGRYQDAIDELDLAERMDTTNVLVNLLNIDRAACYAHLGNLEAALADCARLPDDHWLPGIHGAPGGTKSEIIETIHRLAAEAKKS
jgi:tetratricopeptide (TPR) repeat protein